MKYTGLPYQVKPGDTLESIAAAKLTTVSAWPILYAFNNLPEVIQAGATKIADPDIILAGSMIRLPVIPGITPAYAKTITNSLSKVNVNSLKDHLHNLSLPATFAYDFDSDHAKFELPYPRFTAKVKMKGRVMISMDKKFNLQVIPNGTSRLAEKKEADWIFGKLMSEAGVGYDAPKKAFKFYNKMIMSSGQHKNSPKYAAGVEMSSDQGFAPFLKLEFIYPELSGKLGRTSFFGSEIRIEVEIHPNYIGPKPPSPPAALESCDARHPLLRNTSVALSKQQGQPNWEEMLKNAGTGAIVVAGVITVAYGASIIFSAGATATAAPAYAGTMSAILVGATATTISLQQ